MQGSSAVPVPSQRKWLGLKSAPVRVVPDLPADGTAEDEPVAGGSKGAVQRTCCSGLPGVLSSLGCDRRGASDVVREGARAEAYTPPATSERASLPQVLEVNGQRREFFPTHWGITVRQVRALLEECRQSPKWSGDSNMYDMVRDHVKPRTSGQGCGYALLVNREYPLEASVMISHAWAENAERFVETLERSVGVDEAMFICSFSIFQNEDGSGPNIADQIGSSSTDSPFYQVLKGISSKASKRKFWRSWNHLRAIAPMLAFLLGGGMASFPIFFAGCIPSPGYCARFDPGTSLWIWTRLEQPSYTICFFLGLALMFAALPGQLYLHFFPSYMGRMVVVPNRQCDIYQRLWCVYEIFVASTLNAPVVLGATLAHAGTCSCREAECSSPGDKSTIQQEIMEFGRLSRNDSMSGYDAVDESIRRTMRRAWAPLFVALLFQCSLVGYATFLWPIGSRRLIDAGIPLLPGHVAGNMLGAAVHYSSGFMAAWQETGLVSTRGLLRLLAAQSVAGGVVFSAGFVVLDGRRCDWSEIESWKVNLTAALYNCGLYLLAMAPVFPVGALFKHALVRLGVPRWHLWASLACPLCWLVAVVAFTAVRLEGSSLYPSLFLILTALFVSCGPVLAILLAERWGLQWSPRPGKARLEGALLVLGLLAASGVGWGCSVGAVTKRAASCT